MGEIGIPRREFLNELKWWEVKSLVRGYHARQHSSWEQARLIAYHVRYCMGLQKGEVAKRIGEWLPFSWEQEHTEGRQLTEDECIKMQQEIDAYNRQLAEKAKQE